MYVEIKQQTDRIAHDKSWIWLRKGILKWNVKGEYESLFIVAENNAIRNNYI